MSLKLIQIELFNYSNNCLNLSKFETFREFDLFIDRKTGANYGSYVCQYD